MEAAGLTGVENRGGGGGVPWREGEGRPQVEEWDQGEPAKLIDMLSARQGQPVGRKNRRRGGAASTPRELEVGDDWWTNLQFVETSGA